MKNDLYIPVGVIHKGVEAIDARLEELAEQTALIEKEQAKLLEKRLVLTELEHDAVAPSSGSDRTKTTSQKQRADQQTKPGEEIPDGKVATPIILETISKRPGITSLDLINALHERVRKDINKGPRRFLSDLLWELRHRNKLRRDSEGGLYIVEQEQGGAS